MTDKDDLLRSMLSCASKPIEWHLWAEGEPNTVCEADGHAWVDCYKGYMNIVDDGVRARRCTRCGRKERSVPR